MLHRFLLLMVVSGCLFITGCANQNNQDAGLQEVPMAEDPLTPGTVWVEAAVSKTKAAPPYKNIEIKKVLQYGSSTPLLSEGEQFKVRLSDHISDDSALFEESGKLILLLNHREVLGGEIQWTVLKLTRQ